MLTLGTTLDLTDVVPRSDFAGLPPYQTPREEAGIEQIVIDGKDICDLNIERLRESQSPEREARELDELLRQMRRFVHFLMTGDDSPEDVPLFVGFGPEAGRAIEVDGYRVSYRDGDRVYCRSSPMAARLALLCGREAGAPGGRWPAMTRFLIVNTDYPAFLESLYAANPNLETQGYEPSGRPQCQPVRRLRFLSAESRSTRARCGRVFDQ